MAAASTEDPKGKQVFEALAAEEAEHQRFLQAHHAALLETGALDPKLRLAARQGLEGPSPIFSEQLRARVHEAHYEVSALAVGVQLEANAIAHYRQMADAAPSEDARALFEELVAWETVHYRALLRQQDELAHDYWAQAGFSPF
jgi:rubrerythrin